MTAWILSVFFVLAGALPQSPRDLLQTLERADNANDLNTVIALYADDAVLLPPNERIVAGKDAIRSRYIDLFARTRMVARFEIDDERSGADHASIRGRVIGRRVATGGTVEDLTGKFVMLLARDAAGAWHISALIWNADR